MSAHYNLGGFSAALQEVRSLYADFTLNQVLVLLEIAQNPGITNAELIQRTGLSDASVSRICAILSHYGNRGTKPLHLIKFEDSQQDRRVKLIFLTPQRHALLRLVASHLEGFNRGRPPQG